MWAEKIEEAKTMVKVPLFTTLLLPILVSTVPSAATFQPWSFLISV